MVNHPNRSRRATPPGGNPRPREVAQLREEMELTQTEFGELLYVSLRTVQDWEGGQRHMPPLAWEFVNLLQAYPEVEHARDLWRRGLHREP